MISRLQPMPKLPKRKTFHAPQTSRVPLAVWRSTSTVGLPRESKIYASISQRVVRVLREGETYLASVDFGDRHIDGRREGDDGLESRRGAFFNGVKFPRSRRAFIYVLSYSTQLRTFSLGLGPRRPLWTATGPLGRYPPRSRVTALLLSRASTALEDHAFLA